MTETVSLYVIVASVQLLVLPDSKLSWNTVLVGDAVGVGVGVAVGRGVDVGVAVGLGVVVGDVVGLGVAVGDGPVDVPGCGEVTVGKSSPKDWYLGMLLRFSFIHTVLPTPMLAHCDRKVLSSPTVEVVKLLYSL